METYRVQQYNVNTTSKVESRRVQGGFRWQRFTLLSAGTLRISEIHTIPTVETKLISDLSGQFECSNPLWTNIWRIGARTIQLTDFPAESIPDFWEVTTEGALIESAAPLPYAGLIAQTLSQYRLEFDVKIIDGAFSFKVLSNTLGEGIYIWVNAANSSISAHAGSTELSPVVEVRAFEPNQNSWLAVEVQVNTTEILVLLDGSPALEVSQTYFFVGSFGLGASSGQRALFTNVRLRALDSDEQYYSSDLTSPESLADFAAGTNPLDVSVDGSRRDRIAYAGDLDVSAPSAFASTGSSAFTNGTLHLLGSFQLAPGFFVPTAKTQQPPSNFDIPANITGLIGYSFNLILAMAGYYEMTGDLQSAVGFAARIERMLEWTHSQTLENGLFNLSNPVFGGDWNYYDPPTVGVVTKFNVLYAYALQETQQILRDSGIDTMKYEQRLAELRQAIRDNLWSSELSAFIVSESIRDGFAQDANAIALLSHVGIAGNQSSGGESQATLEETVLNSLNIGLSTKYGPLAFSNSTVQQGFSQKLSPFASAYHLRAAFQAHDEQTVSYLLDSLWATMANTRNENFSGNFWEVLNTDGTPGLGITTSLCHAWASGPVSELSRNVLGVKPAAPGYQEWLVAPFRAGLDWAKGRHPTPHGHIKIEWSIELESGCLESLIVRGPENSNGTVDLQYLLPPMLNKTCPPIAADVNGTEVSSDGLTFQLVGDEMLTLSSGEPSDLGSRF